VAFCQDAFTTEPSAISLGEPCAELCIGAAPPLAERLRQREPAEIKKPPLLTPLSLFPVSHGDRCRQRRNEAGHSL